MTTPDADPPTPAELDALDALNRARTPGPVAMTIDNRGRAHLYGGEDGAEWIDLAEPDEVRAVAAALNALPALLAEVRASRVVAAPYLIDALEAYGRAFCRAAHLDTQARRTALADAERAVLRCVEGASK